MDDQEYYLIGEVAKICNISIKTLRFYDDIDLLKPELVNKENNYRYYTKQQLLLIAIIKELKESEFSLDDIRNLLKRNNLEELKSSLEIKISDITKKINKLKNIKKRMGVYVDGINTIQEMNQTSFMKDKKAIPLPVEFKYIPRIPVAFTRYRCPSNPDAFTLRYSELQSLIEKHELTRIGPRMAIFYDDYKDFDFSSADIEVCSQISTFYNKLSVVRKYGGFSAAVTVFKGTYGNIPEQYGRMLSFISQNGYDYVGPATEKYIMDAGSTSDEQNYITELILPVKKKVKKST